jgi:hypothetical protein
MSYDNSTEIEGSLLSHICEKDVSVTTDRHANNLQSKRRQNRSHL